MAATNYPGERPPLVLSGQLTAQADNKSAYDVLIGGVPFRLRPSQEDPRIHQVDSGLKDQFDSSQEAGENSFGQWWLRSQATFHGGAGQTYLDSAETQLSRARFLSSECAVVHAPGEVTPAGELTSSATGRLHCEQVTWSGTQRLVTTSSSGPTVHWADLPSMANSDSATLTGASGPAASTATDGTSVYVAISDRIYRVDSGGAVVHTYNLTFTGTVVLGYAKQRLIACVGNKVYELETHPVGPPVAAPSAHYTHPVPTYTYTAVAEGPNGIYLSGYAGPASDVSSMSVTESAGTVVLGPPVVQLRMPLAERVNDVVFYLGTLFALATSLGVRIGTFTPYGQPQMGPLLHTGPTYSLAAAGTLIYAGGVDSTWWVDLATPTDAGAYAYSQNCSGVGASTGDTVTGVTVVPSGSHNLLFGVTAAGWLVTQPEFVAVDHATLTTSWSRFGTIEPKRLHYVAIDGDFPDADSLSVTVETADGNTKTFGVGAGTVREFGVVDLPASQAYRLSFTLRSGTLRGYQLKALPQPQRYAQVILPLECSDHERPHTGEQVGYQGFALERYAALEALARQAAPVTVTDRTTGTAYRAVIDRLQFRQETAPTREGGFAGVVVVILKVV